MNWDDDNLRAAALRLLLTASVRASKIAAPLVEELEELGIVAQGSRSLNFRLLPGQRNKLKRYLEVRWPGVVEAEAAFATCPAAINAGAIRARRRAGLVLPPEVNQLNRRTWAAWSGAHAKSGLHSSPDHIAVTTDGVARIRPNPGLQLVGEDNTVLASESWRSMFAELILPQRAFDRHWRLCGILPGLILTVENLGAYIDFPSAPWLLLVHAPGHDTSLAMRLIERLPAEIPWLHFGDLDPAGLRIALSMRTDEQNRRPIAWIPATAEKLLASHSLPYPSSWPVERLPPAILTNAVVAWLASKQRWLEQEAVVLVPGLIEELALLANAPRSGADDTIFHHRPK